MVDLWNLAHNSKRTATARRRLMKMRRHASRAVKVDIKRQMQKGYTWYPILCIVLENKANRKRGQK